MDIERIDLEDFTFLIPVRIDSKDRLENLEITVDFILKNLNTKVCIQENDRTPRTPEHVRKKVNYVFNKDSSEVFWRTRINNELIQRCETQFALIYDVDVIIPIVQIHKAANLLRSNKAQFVLPYDGSFYHVDKWHRKIFKTNLSIDFLTQSSFYHTLDSTMSVGGAFSFNSNVYKTAGMENQDIQGWGHDDAERVKRLQILGYRVHRVDGPLFHLWHTRNVNSYFFDTDKALQSYKVFLAICKQDKHLLQDQIKTWKWLDRI